METCCIETFWCFSNSLILSLNKYYPLLPKLSVKLTFENQKLFVRTNSFVRGVKRIAPKISAKLRFFFRNEIKILSLGVESFKSKMKHSLLNEFIDTFSSRRCNVRRTFFFVRAFHIHVTFLDLDTTRCSHDGTEGSCKFSSRLFFSSNSHSWTRLAACVTFLA